MFNKGVYKLVNSHGASQNKQLKASNAKMKVTISGLFAWKIPEFRELARTEFPEIGILFYHQDYEHSLMCMGPNAQRARQLPAVGGPLKIGGSRLQPS